MQLVSYPSNTSYYEFLDRLPKAELHCHLIGSMRAATAAELARKHGLRLPAPAEELYAHVNSRSAPSISYAHTRIPVPAPDPEAEPEPSYSLFQVADWVAPVLRDRDDFARVGYEAAVDAYRSSNVIYREMAFEPTTFYAHGVSYGTMVDGLIEGQNAAEKEYGVVSRLIVGLDRGEPPAEAVQAVQDALDDPRDEVIGVGLQAYELAGPPERFAEAYALAKRGGLHRTAHAAEHDPSARNIATCLDLLGCERIDHGYFVLEDEAMVARCREEGAHFSCIFTTSRRAWRPFRRASIKAMVEGGLQVNLASDDPAMFPTTLNQEYRVAVSELGFGLATMRGLYVNAIEASFLDDDRKRELRRLFSSTFDEMEKVIQV